VGSGTPVLHLPKSVGDLALAARAVGAGSDNSALRRGNSSKNFSVRSAFPLLNQLLYLALDLFNCIRHAGNRSAVVEDEVVARQKQVKVRLGELGAGRRWNCIVANI